MKKKTTKYLSSLMAAVFLIAAMAVPACAASSVEEQMAANSAAWWVAYNAGDTETCEKLHEENQKLAEKAGVSRSLISAIEAPGLANGFSLEVFFDIADALEVDPADLINASIFPDPLLKKK